MAVIALAGVLSVVAPWMLSAAAAQSISQSNGPDRRLVDAVQQRDFDTARELLAGGGIDLNTAQGDGATAVAWAAHWDEVDLASGLIAAGADVRAANDLGVTPLMLAADNGSLPMVELLLGAGADPEAPRPGRRLRAPPATRPSCSRRGPILLREGEAANPAEFPRDGETDPPRTAGGFTTLLYAVLTGDMETVRVLVDNGADINDASPDGVSALMLALTKRHEDLALLLIERGADPNYDRRNEILDAYAYLADGQDPLAVETPEEADDFAGYTALHVAAATRQHRALRAMLAAGADPNARMDRPKRFIEAFEVGVFASPGAGRLTQVGTTPFMLAAKTADAEAMRILAEAGADPFATTDDGATALILAAGLGKRAAQDITYYDWDQHKAIEAARYALELGVDINAANAWGATALHAATYHAADELIRFLVENGAELDATDWEEQTPLRLARGHMICCSTYVEHPDIADLLRELGADPEAGERVTFGLLGYHADERENAGDGNPPTSGEPR